MRKQIVLAGLVLFCGGCSSVREIKRTILLEEKAKALKVIERSDRELKALEDAEKN